VTPELIQEVLAKPCHLRVKDLAHAEELFDSLAQEEALVVVDGRALRHRPDVRPVMVRLLRDTNPGRSAPLRKRPCATTASARARRIGPRRSTTA